MSISKTFLLVLSAMSILLAAPISAQEVDYSGSWELDKAESTLQGWMAENLLSMNMEILHENKNLRIVYTYSFTSGASIDTLQVVIDGEAVSGKWWNGSIDFTTRAQMGDKNTNLILETKSTYRGQNGSFTTNYAETVRLSENKKSLIIDRIAKSDFDTTRIKLMFRPADRE